MQFFKSCAWYEVCPLRGRGGRVNKKYLRAYQAATRAKTFPNRLSQLSCICILHYFACDLHLKESYLSCFYVAWLLSCAIQILIFLHCVGLVPFRIPLPLFICIWLAHYNDLLLHALLITLSAVLYYMWLYLSLSLHLKNSSSYYSLPGIWLGPCKIVFTFFTLRVSANQNTTFSILT